MTDFQWLSGDRMVQRTRFGDKLELIANFGDHTFTYGQFTIPARSVLAKPGGSGTVQIFSPGIEPSQVRRNTTAQIHVRLPTELRRHNLIRNGNYH